MAPPHPRSAWSRFWERWSGLLMILMKVVPCVPGHFNALRMAGAGNLGRAGCNVCCGGQKRSAGVPSRRQARRLSIGVSSTQEFAVIMRERKSENGEIMGSSIVD